MLPTMDQKAPPVFLGVLALSALSHLCQQDSPGGAQEGGPG